MQFGFDGRRGVVNDAGSDSPRTLLRREAGVIFTNLGSSGTVQFNLPADAEVSDSFNFFVAAGHTLAIEFANALDTFAVGGAVQAANKGITCATIGSSVGVTKLAANVWAVTPLNGTWTVDS